MKLPDDLPGGSEIDSNTQMNLNLFFSLNAHTRFSSLLIDLTSITIQFATTDVHHPFVRSYIHLTARSSPRPTIEGSTVAFEQIPLTSTGRGSTDGNCHAPRHRTNHGAVQLRKDRDVAGWRILQEESSNRTTRRAILSSHGTEQSL